MLEALPPHLPDVSAARPAASHTKDDPGRVLGAARQFEALLVGQMLRSIRESGSGSWLGSEEDQAGDSAMALAEDYFASAVSQAGGLGLADLIAAGLRRRP